MSKKNSKKPNISKESLRAPGEELLGLEDVIRPDDSLEKDYGMNEDEECESEEEYPDVGTEDEDVFGDHEGGRGNDRYYVGRWINRLSNIKDMSSLNRQDKDLIERLVEVVDYLNDL